MLKRLLIIGLIASLGFSSLLSVYAENELVEEMSVPQDCMEDVERALSNVMGYNDPQKPVESIGIEGYLQQLDSMISTNTMTYLLIDEAQQLARKARIELKGICREVERFDLIDENYIAAYKLDSCKNLETMERADLLEIISFCQTKSDQMLNAFLDRLSFHLQQSAIRTSVEPVVQRLRGLNSKLTQLISEYNRLINNFFTFNFRLGDAITKEWD